MRTKARSRCLVMMLLNISCRGVAQSEGLDCSAFGEDKAEFRRCRGTPTRRAEMSIPSKKVGYHIPLSGALLPTFMPCRSGRPGGELRTEETGILQFRLAHLAIEYRWLCFCQSEVIGADQFRTWHRSQGGRFFCVREIIYFIPQ